MGGGGKCHLEPFTRFNAFDKPPTRSSYSSRVSRCLFAPEALTLYNCSVALWAPFQPVGRGTRLPNSRLCSMWKVSTSCGATIARICDTIPSVPFALVSVVVVICSSLTGIVACFVFATRLYGRNVWKSFTQIIFIHDWCRLSPRARAGASGARCTSPPAPRSRRSRDGVGTARRRPGRSPAVRTGAPTGST